MNRTTVTKKTNTYRKHRMGMILPMAVLCLFLIFVMVGIGSSAWNIHLRTDSNSATSATFVTGEKANSQLLKYINPNTSAEITVKDKNGKNATYPSFTYDKDEHTPQIQSTVVDTENDGEHARELPTEWFDVSYKKLARPNPSAETLDGNDSWVYSASEEALATAPSDAGIYRYIVSANDNAGKYKDFLGTTSMIFVIRPKDADVWIISDESIYGNKHEPNVIAEGTEKFVGNDFEDLKSEHTVIAFEYLDNISAAADDDSSILHNLDEKSIAGYYKIIPTDTSSNYKITYQLGKRESADAPIVEADASDKVCFTINKREIEISFDTTVELSKVYGDEVDESVFYKQLRVKDEDNFIRFTYENGNYISKLWNDDDIKEVISLSSNVSVSSNVGNYQIIPELISDNYEITVGSNTRGLYVVTKATLTLTAVDTSVIYGEEAEYSVSYTGFVLDDDENCLSVPVSFKCDYKVGDSTTLSPFTITPALPEQANYFVEFVDGELTIIKRALTVELKNSTSVYGEEITAGILQSSILSGTVYGDDVAYTLSTTANSSSPVGTYPVFVVADNENYAITCDNDGIQLHTITKANLTITAEDTTISFGEDIPTFTSIIEGAKNDDSFEISYTCDYTQGDSAGTYDIVPSISESLKDEAPYNNYNITFINGTLTVEQKTIEIEWLEMVDGKIELTYNGLVQTPTAISKDTSIECNFVVTIISDDENAGKDVGTYIAEVSASANSNYILPEDTTIEFTIVPRPITIEWSEDPDDFKFEYDGESHGPIPTVGNIIEGDDCSFTFEGAETEIGSYFAKISDLTNPNYALPDGSFEHEFEIVPKVVTLLYGGKDINETPITFAYNKTARYPTLSSFTLSGVLEAEKSSVTISMALDIDEPSINVGEYFAILTLNGAKAGNYTLENNRVPYKITPVALNVSVKNPVYNGLPQKPIITLSNFVSYSGDQASAIVVVCDVDGNPVEEPINYGTAYKAKIVGLEGPDAQNYVITNATYANGKVFNFQITKAPLTATPKPVYVEENDPVPTSFELDIVGFVNGEDESVFPGYFTFTTPYKQGSSIGRYTITPKYNGTQPTNYSITSKVGYLYCGSVIVKPTAVSMEYNGEEQTFIPKDFNPDQMTIEGNVQTDAGTYTATISLKQELIDAGFTWDDLTTDPFELTWKIDRMKIPYPEDEHLEFVYDNQEHSFTLPEGYDASLVTLSGTLTNKTYGNKTYYITPNDNYQWENGTTTRLTRVWKIIKATMTLPDGVPYDPVNGITWVTEFVYDGTPHCPFFEDYDEDTINEYVTYWRNLGAIIQIAVPNASGVFSYNNNYGFSRVDAGTYGVKIYPGGNCTWPDGTATTYTQTWIIKQKELTFHNSDDYFEINLPSDFYTWQFVDAYVTTKLGIEGIVGDDEVTILTQLLTNGNGLDYTITVNATNGAKTYSVVLGEQYTKMGLTVDVAVHNFIGSTYRGVGFTLGGARFKNYFISEETQNKTYVLKYKSVLVGNTYYTIEDALAQSGEIVVPAKETFTNPTPNDYSGTANFYTKYSLTNDDVFMITDYSSRKAAYVDPFYIDRYDVLAKYFTNMLSDVDANYLSFLEKAGIALTNNINLIKGSNATLVNNTVLFKINNGTYSMVHNPSGSDYDFNTIIARLVGLDTASNFNNKAKAIVNEFKSNSAKVSANGYAIDRLRYNGTIYTDSGIFIIPLKFRSNKANVDVYGLFFVTDDGSMYVLLSNYENAYKTANMNNVMNCTSSAFATITITGRKGMYFNKTYSQTMTTFTGLTFNKSANFTNYSDNFSYSHSSRIFLKTTADGTNGYSNTTINNSVLSCLIIPGEVKDEDGNVTFPGITLNLTGDIVVPGVIMYQGSVYDRAVIVNNGTINQNSGTIYSYGFIKGDGYINLASGAKLVDMFEIYDWLGGANSYGIINNAKNVFPFNVYSLHNVSCHTIINYGASYYARFLAQTSVVDFDKELLIIGTSGALFNVTSNGSYIDKFAANAESQPTATALYTIGGSNQVRGQRDVVEIHGDCLDGTISVTQSGTTIDASKSRPMPVTYMDILVAEGTLTLNTISYKFHPGASLTVAENANLSVGNGVTMFFYSVDQCIVDSAYTASGFEYTPLISETAGYVVDRTDAYICVNGKATFNSGSSFGGLLTTATAGARLELNGASEATVYKITSITYSRLGSSVKQAQTSCASNGNVLGIPGTRLTTGSYISSPYGDEFVWGATKADIVFDKNYSDSGESSVIKTLSNKDMPYTLTLSDYPTNPSRTYYTLETDSNGRAVWYSDSECTKVFNVGDMTYSGLVLYAHWIPIEYTVKYGYVYKDGLTASDVNHNVPTETFIITAESGSITDFLIDPSVINVVNGFTFYGWFTTASCANKVGDALDLLKEATINTSDNSVTIYGSWEIYVPSFTVAFETGSGLEDDYTFPKGYSIDVVDETVKISEQGTWRPTAAFPEIETDKEVKYYFGGWYLDKECTNAFTSFSGMTIEEKSTVTLYSKWLEKNKLDAEVFGVSADALSIYYVSGYTFRIPDPKTYGLDYYDTDYVYATFQGGSLSSTTEYKIGDSVKLTNETNVIVKKLTRYQVNATLTNTTINSLTFTGHYSEDGTNVVNGTKTFGSINANKSPWFYVYDGNITNITFTYAQTKNQSFKVNGTNYTNNSNTSVAVNGANITIVGSSEQDTGGGGCLAAGTMFLMPDGTQKKVEDLTVDDYILVFNHETGKYQGAKVLFIADDGWDYWEVIELNFADGTSVKVIYEHGFFDLTENKYVYFDAYNYEQYLGHEFATTTWNGYEYVTGRTTLTNVKVYTEFTGCYEPTTYYFLNTVVNGLMSMPGGIQGMFNFFDYDPNTLAYDEDSMQKDIETYGLLTYDFFKDYFSYGVYCMFPAQYVGISLGKGLMTEEYLMYLIDYYIGGFNLEDEVEKQPDQSENPSPYSGVANPLANVVIPPSTSSSSGGSNNDGSNDDDNG